MKTKYSDQDLAKIKAMHDAGATHAQIIAETNVPRGSVTAVLKRANNMAKKAVKKAGPGEADSILSIVRGILKTELSAARKLQTIEAILG